MNDNRDLQQHELHELQRRVARMDARFRIILGGALMAAVVGILTWAPIAMSEPDAPYPDVYDDLYRFTPNTPAVAEEINSNFALLRSLTEDNANQITALGSSIIDGSRVQNGTLTTGKLADGAVTASKLASGAVNTHVRDYIRNNCYIYMGWRDACNGCGLDPAVWAKKRVGNGNDTCDGGSPSGETSCRAGWAGIGTSGDVDGNDQFFVKLLCE